MLEEVKLSNACSILDLGKEAERGAQKVRVFGVFGDFRNSQKNGSNRIK
jgi:hypothetical protein